MDGFKEFQGKDLDSAINEACAYFNLAREKLEIEILQDAKSGIFGIVGARKAKIRAHRAKLPETLKNLLGKKNQEETPPAGTEPPSLPADAAANVPDPGSASEAKAFTPEVRESDGNAAAPDGRSRGRTRKNGTRQEASTKKADQNHEAKKAEHAAESVCELADDSLNDVASDMPQTPMEELDPERLQAFALEAAGKIVGGIVGESAEIAAEVCRGRVRIVVDCSQDSGLLIGRDGQTLSAVQYLLSRIVSRGMNAAVRVQMEAGDYRQKQEDKLKALALALAEKARRSGRAFSTRPLSSYHRRIVHLSLQNTPDIQTRSTGEGPLKRVVIQRQKTEK